MVAEINNI